MNHTDIATELPAPAAPSPRAAADPRDRCFSTGRTYGRRLDSGCPDCEHLPAPGAPAGDTARVIPACSTCFPADTERSDYEFTFETPAFGDWMARDMERACLRCGERDNPPYGVLRWRGRLAPPRCDCELRWTAAATAWTSAAGLLVLPRGAAVPTGDGPQGGPVPVRVSLWKRAEYRAASALFPDPDTARLAAITVDAEGAVLEVREAAFPESLGGDSAEPTLAAPGPILTVAAIRPDRAEARKAAHHRLAVARRRAPQRLDLDFPLDFPLAAPDHEFSDRRPALRFENWPAALDGDWTAYSATRFDDSRLLTAERPGRHTCAACAPAPKESP